MRKTGFDALDLANEISGLMTNLLVIIQRHDPKLADEARRAMQSVTLNLREGRKRSGKDRQHLFKTANGSNEEIRGALDHAEIAGYLTAEQTDPVQELCDREAAMLRRLSGFSPATRARAKGRVPAPRRRPVHGRGRRGSRSALHFRALALPFAIPITIARVI